MSRSRNLVTALAALLLAVPSLQAVDLQSVAGADTKLRVYGFVHIVGNYFVDEQQNPGGSRLASSFFYFPVSSQNGQADKNILINYAPTRLGFASTTATSSLGDISTKIEMDFNGTNYPHTRLAQIDIGGWTIGQAWSTWVDGDAGADTVDWAGPVGTPCFDTPRFPLIRYTAKIDKNNTFAVSLEQNGGYNDGASEISGLPKKAGLALNQTGVTAAGAPIYGLPIATSTAVASTGVPDGKIPTIVAAYTYSADWGHIGLRGLAQNVGAFVPATSGSAAVTQVVTAGVITTAGAAAVAPTASQRYSKIAAAFMLSGDVKFGKDDLVYNIYTGDALGQYGTGLQAAVLNDATQTVTVYKSIGWMAGYTHNWTDAVRSNLILSGTTFKSDSNLPGTDATSGGDMKSGLSGNINTFVKLAKNTELGMEYVYEGAKAFGTTDGSGWVDKDGKATNSNHASKLEVTLHVGF